jgi:hypothetical protein
MSLLPLLQSTPFTDFNNNNLYFEKGTTSLLMTSDGTMTLSNTATGDTMTLGSGGFDYNGSSVDYGRLNALRAVCPSVTPTILGVNNTISLQNADTLGTATHIINLSSGDPAIVGEHFGIIYSSTSNNDFVFDTTGTTGSVLFKNINNPTNQIQINANVPNIVITDGTNTNTITATGGGGGGSQNIQQVLTTGDDAGGLSITNLNNISVSTINGGSYPPSIPDLTAVLGAGNSASGYDINGVNNLQCNTINGGTITTIGLTWSDFQSQNAYNNLPSSNAYALDNSSGSQAETRATGFYCYNNGSLMGQSCSTLITPYTWTQQVASNEWLRYDYNGGSAYFKLGYDNGSNGTTFSQIDNGVFITYQKSFGTGYEWRGRFIMEADNGLIISSKDETNNIYKSIKLNASDCFLYDGVSSVSLKPKITGSVNGSANWGIGAGGWNNIVSTSFGMSSSWSGNKNFAVSLTFNNYDAQENTASLYFYIMENGVAYYPFTSNSSYAVPCFAHNGFANNSTTANITDVININNSGSSTLTLYINIAHNGGTWSGNGFWSLTLVEV